MTSPRNIRTQLVAIAEALGYSVVFRRTKAMGRNEIGMTCPDINKIYIDPKGGDLASTLAHEIAHAILLVAEPPGHRGAEDTAFESQIAENAADEIGAALCRALGVSPDFDGVGERALKHMVDARRKYGDTEAWQMFMRGYCLALSDTLPSSDIGLDQAISMVKGKRKGRGNGKVSTNGLRIPRPRGSRIIRRRKHR